jgi:hypothetical protein
LLFAQKKVALLFGATTSIIIFTEKLDILKDTTIILTFVEELETVIMDATFSIVTLVENLIQ